MTGHDYERHHTRLLELAGNACELARAVEEKRRALTHLKETVRLGTGPRDPDVDREIAALKERVFGYRAEGPGSASACRAVLDHPKQKEPACATPHR